MIRKSPLVAYVVLLALAAIIAAILLTVAGTPGWYGVARGAALVGYQFVVLSVVSSAFVRPLVRAYRKPFVKLHHWVSITGLALLVLHPILLVIVTRTPSLLTAAYTSGEFFRNAGSPALAALVIGAVAAILKSRIVRVWRYVHWLNYIALILGTIHAILIGTSVAMLPALRWGFVLLAGVGVAVYIKRLTKPPAPARSRR
ncbi:MAG: ferric reductase-like transmembrane domain-containing protein [Anaerolineae bacterium]